MLCVRDSFTYFMTMLRLCQELTDGPIVNVLAMSSMICVKLSRKKSDPNLVLHPFPDVQQTLKIVVIKYIN